MKKTSMKMLLCAGICAASMAGTGIIGYAATEGTVGETRIEGQKPPQDDGSVMAKITAVDGETLSVVISDMPTAHAGAGKLEDGGTPPEKPADGEVPPESPANGETPPEKPADGEIPQGKPADGETPPEKPAGKSTENGKEKQLTMEFTGETVSLALTSETIITKGRERTEEDASALTVDSVVRLMLDGTTITSIDIME